MINLNLAIYEGDVKKIEFHTKENLCDYLKELKRFNCIWLATKSDLFGEILITENVDFIINSIKNDMIKLHLQKPVNFFVQEYQTYEDAYKVALDMREPNPNCYN